MALMRVLTKVDEDGRIRIPKNIRRQTGLSPGVPVEIKVQGPNVAQVITIGKRPTGQRLPMAVSARQDSLCE